MKRLSHIRLIPLFCLFFLLPVHATEKGIIERKLRDGHYLKRLMEGQKNSQFVCCGPIIHRGGVHPHILSDCELLITNCLKKRALKRITVPSCIRKLLVRYLAGDFDRNYFDKICFVHNDTGAFIACIPNVNQDGDVYPVDSFGIPSCRNPYRKKHRNILVCKAFTTQYGISGRDKHGYNRAGYDWYGYNRLGCDKDGYNRAGRNSDGYNRAGYDVWGYNRDGYDKHGYCNDGYDLTGYDRNGHKRDGAGVILDPILIIGPGAHYDDEDDYDMLER